MHTQWGDPRTVQIGYSDIGRVMIDMLTLEMVFFAVLFVIIVNIHWRPNKKPERSQ